MNSDVGGQETAPREQEVTMSSRDNGEEGKQHRVGRVLSFFSSRRNWDSPKPSAEGECGPPLWYRGEGHTRWRESPNSDEGTYTAVLCKYMYFVASSIKEDEPEVTERAKVQR
jgi:hypothetical protein